jgi:hypothetical protein
MRLAGRYGQVKIQIGAGTTIVVPMASYSMNMERDFIDVTIFGDSNIVELPGLQSLSGDFSGFYETTTAWQLFAAAQATTTPTLTLALDTANNPNLTFSGPANISASISQTVNGAIEISGNWSAAASWDLSALTTPPPTATGATAGAPGTWTPAGSLPRANLAAMTGCTASPATVWTTAQHVVMLDNNKTYWNGTAWTAGQAP